MFVIIFLARWMMPSQSSTPAEMKSNDGDILSCQFFNTTTSTILLPIIPVQPFNKLRLQLLKLLLLMKWTTLLSRGCSTYISTKENQFERNIIQIITKRNILRNIFFQNFPDQPIQCFNFLFHLFLSLSFRFHVG